MQQHREPSSTDDRSTEDLLQADPASLGSVARRPITSPVDAGADALPAVEHPSAPASPAPHERTFADVSEELTRGLSELQTRVAGRFAAEAAEEPSRGGLRGLMKRRRRHEPSGGDAD